MQDRIIAAFISRANSYLATPVHTGSVEISVIRHFPLLSLTFNDVRVEDSHPDDFVLFSARRVDLSFSATDAWNGKYEILGLDITDSRTHIRYNKTNEGNFRIFSDTTQDAGALKFDIRDITLTRALVSYADAGNGDQHQFRSELLRADVGFADGVYSVRTTGDILFDQVRLGNRKFLSGKRFDVSMVLTADPETSTADIERADLRYGDAAFSLHGYYDFGAVSRLDLKLEGINTSLESIQTFLPAEFADALAPYRSSGDLNFSLQVSGSPEDSRSMVAVAGFGCREASFQHPSSGFIIEQATLAGKFTVLGARGEQGSELKLDSISGKLNGKPFSGRVLWQQQDDPYLDVAWSGEVDALDLKSFLPDSTLYDPSGRIKADIKLTGHINDLKSKETATRFGASGTLRFRDFSISGWLDKLNLSDWNGMLSLNGNDLTVEKLGGRLGNSDLLLSGALKNLLGYLLLPDQHLGADLYLSSRKIDMNEILAFRSSDSANTKGDTQLDISPRLHLRLSGEIGHLVFDRLHAREVTGKLVLDRQQVRFQEFRFRAFGGDAGLDGVLDASAPHKFRLMTAINLERNGLDSIFHVFHDFGQGFISEKHVRGLVNASIRLDLAMDRQLRLLPEELSADVAFDIQKGQLNDFEPMYALNRFLGDEGLRRLRFADLRNEIQIRDKTVFIPSMEIRSNVTTIQLAGRHGFDQRIDYRIVAPLVPGHRINEEEAGSALGRDDAGKPKLYLKITGTTDKYEVSYDGAAVRKKITNDIRREAKALKESFRKRDVPDPKTKPKLSEEAFDWEN